MKTRSGIFRSGLLLILATVVALAWWFYKPSIDPFTLTPDMNIEMLHAAGLEDGCGVCHADALPADDDVCLSCHTATENTPPAQFSGPGTGSNFNLPHHDIPATIDDPETPGCVDGDCHDMSADARYTDVPNPDQDYCHNPECHASMLHNS